MLALLLTLFCAAAPPASGRVASVYDGDTLTLDTGDKIRLKWVNTPERRPPEPFADEAKAFTERLVLGREVELVVAPGSERDGYGRLIAGVRTARDDLSLRLLEEGYGHVFLIPPESIDPAPLLAAQQRARDGLRGIWSTDRYRSTLHISSFHANARGDDSENVNGEYLRVCNITAGPIDLLGYTLVSGEGRRFPLPHLVLPAGHTVLIHSGHGEHRVDPSAQLQIYLGQPGPIWDDLHAVASLVDASGDPVDQARHDAAP